MIWLFGDGVLPLSRRSQTEKVCSLILAELMLPDIHKNSGTVPFFASTVCLEGGRARLVWYRLQRDLSSCLTSSPVAPLPAVSVHAVEMVLVAFVPL